MTSPTHALHAAGQSLWLDNITRTLLDDGTIKGYIERLDVTGLTSNPSIFDKAVSSGAYDDAIRAAAATGNASAEEIFFGLAIDDLRRAADMFLKAHRDTDGVDGWVSLEVSPELAHDTEATVRAATSLHARADRPNLFIKIPGTPEGLPAIEQAIFAGVPVNVTLLFDKAQYLAAADAYLSGIERRISAGLDPVVGSVASVFMSRWDKAIEDRVPAELRNGLGLAVGHDIYGAYRELMDSERWQVLAGKGARMQRLLWASTSTKDPSAPDTLYVTGLAAPFTVNTMPDSTLKAFADHGEIGAMLPADGGDAAARLAAYTAAGIDLVALAATLQSEGAAAFVESWRDLIAHVAAQAGIPA